MRTQYISFYLKIALHKLVEFIIHYCKLIKIVCQRQLIFLQMELQGLGGNRTDDFSTPVSSGSNMSGIARFPKLDECAHFHYEHVELSTLEVRC